MYYLGCQHGVPLGMPCWFCQIEAQARFSVSNGTGDALNRPEIENRADTGRGIPQPRASFLNPKYQAELEDILKGVDI